MKEIAMRIGTLAKRSGFSIDTLRSIPTFDAHGLWFYGEIRFSKHGTLRATLVFLVRQAPEGYTHEELEALVGLRVHNTLRSLVEAQEIGRERVAAVFMYVDSDPSRAAAQLDRRRRRTAKVAPAPAQAETQHGLDLAQVVDVLLAVIRYPRRDEQGLATYLGTNGIQVSAKQVEEILTRYAVKKKTARSRSLHSQR
jgi:hypothetical protein